MTHACNYIFQNNIVFEGISSNLAVLGELPSCLLDSTLSQYETSSIILKILMIDKVLN